MTAAIRVLLPVFLLATKIPRIWAPPLTGAGYTIFVPNHRATPAFHYPDPVHDIQRAVRFVRHNAARFKVDTNRLGGIGGSSGGHLIALMGMMDGKAEDDSDDPIDRQSAKPASARPVLSACGSEHGTGRCPSWRVAADSAAHTEKSQGVGQTVPRSFPHLLRDHGRSPDASHGRRRRYQRSAPSRNRTSRRFAEDARSVQADNHSARNAWADFRIGRRRGTAGRLAGLPRRDGAMVRPAPEDDDARALRRRFRLTRPLSRSDCRPQYRERID